MKLLDRYILKEFLRFFIIIFITFITLYLIIDFFGKLNLFLKENASMEQITLFFFYSIPTIISLIVPPAALLATLMAYGSLSKFSEIIAMKANGISLYRITLPTLIFAVLMSIFLFYFNELITPASLQKAEYIRKIDIEKRSTVGSFKQNEIWYHGDNEIYNFKIFDINNDTLRGVTIHYLNNDFTLRKRIDAQRAEWKDNKWVFHNILSIEFDSDNSPILEKSDEKIIDMPEKPDDFKIVQKNAEKMGYFDLKKYVNKIKMEGYDVTQYLVSLQGKIASPFVLVILIIIGVSFSLRSERSGGVMQSVGIGIFIGFSYFGVHALIMSFGLSGKIHPFMAAWGANILFSITAAILFYRVRS